MSAPAPDAFELVVEDVVEVAGLEDELLADDVLVDADVVGAGALRAGRGDVELRDVGCIAGLQELRVEAGELEGEGGLLNAGGVVGAEFGAVEVSGAGTDGNVGEADARGSGDAVEVVLLDAAAEGVEDAVHDVTLELQGVLVVGALDGLVLVGGDEAAALVLVAEAEESGDAVEEGVVGLVVELVAVGDGVFVGDEEGGLAGGAVAVGSADGDDVAEVLGEESRSSAVPKLKVMGVPTLVKACSCSRLRAMP